MDALIPALIAALLAECGDRTQLLGCALGHRYRSAAAVIAGIALAAGINAALAAAAGGAAAALVDHRALRLLTGLSLVLAGVGALFRPKPAPDLSGWRLGAFASSAGSFLILAFGDKTQFVTAAIAGASDRPVFAGIGSAMGVTIANVPAVILGERWPALVPLRAIRLAAGAALAVAGLAVAALALGIG